MPFFKEVSYPLGVLGFVMLTYLVIVGSSNAVNLTDGLDGLAIMPVVMVGAALGVFAYVTGNAVFAKYLLLPAYPGLGRAADVLRAPWPVPAWPSCGSTPTRRRCSWVTSARWRWAAPWAPSP